MNKIEGYILNQDSANAMIIEKLRQLILSCSPFITERLVYKIPFYYGHKRICYINAKKDSVDLGICNGFELSNHQGLLESKNRNTVKTITFKSLSEIDDILITEIIHEAILIDEKFKK